MKQNWLPELIGSYNPYPLKRNDFFVAIGVFIFSLFTYTITLTPSVSAGDNGELTSAIFYLGLGHAPGYPIHSMFGKLFTFIPIGNIGWRANFYSAFSGALTIYFSCLVYIKMLGSVSKNQWFKYLSAVVGSLVFCFSPVLWSQSITTEVYAISAIFYPLLTLIILKWFDQIYSRQGSDIPYFGENYLLAFAFVLGVGLGGHQTLSITELFFGSFVAFGLLFFQILPRKDFENFFIKGIWHFSAVMIVLAIAWYFYITKIVSLKTNLFVNDYAFLKTGVEAFVICNIILLGYYLVYKFFIPTAKNVHPNNSFHRLAFFVVKFFGMIYLGLFVYFYLFIRSHGNPPINWGGIDQSVDWWGKIAKFFTMINRKQFSPNTLPSGFSVFYEQVMFFASNNIFKQFTIPFWIVMALGGVQLFQKSKFYLIWLLIGFVSFTIQLVLYINYDVNPIDLFFVEVFFIFSYFILSIFIPFGIMFLYEKTEWVLSKIIKEPIVQKTTFSSNMSSGGYADTTNSRETSS